MHAYLHTHGKHTAERGREQETTDTVLTNQKSHTLLLLSVLLFSLLSLLSLLLYFLIICILSHASLACSLWPPGAASSSVDVPTLLLPTARWRLSIANQMFFFFFFTPYSGTEAVSGSPWQPWDGALEAITAVLWWHSNSYHYTSSKEAQREEGGWEGKREMRQGRMDGWEEAWMKAGRRGKEAVGEQVKERRSGNVKGERWEMG